MEPSATPLDEHLIKRAARANLEAYNSEGAAAYVEGAPHLKHQALRLLYAGLLVDLMQAARREGATPRVLDLGAGEGSVTLPLLELGAQVTAVDISPDQLAELKRKCARFGDRLILCCADIADTLKADANRYDIIVANSFLHHIPDYLGLLHQLVPRLSASGQFFSFQDPLLYSSQSRFERLFEKIAYASWRVRNPDAWAGMLRAWRRARGIYLPDSAHDNAEYHVLRAGVDQEAIGRLFTDAGFECRLIKYFSTQSRFFQPVGAWLNIQNTFAFIARRRQRLPVQSASPTPG